MWKVEFWGSSHNFWCDKIGNYLWNNLNFSICQYLCCCDSLLNGLYNVGIEQKTIQYEVNLNNRKENGIWLIINICHLMFNHFFINGCSFTHLSVLLLLFIFKSAPSNLFYQFFGRAFFYACNRTSLNKVTPISPLLVSIHVSIF